MATAKSTASSPARAILSGAIALSAAISIGAPADPATATPFSYSSTTAWNTLFAEWRRADAAYNAPCTLAEEEELGARETAAWIKLMKTPAPNGAALLWKMEYLWGGTGDGDGSSTCWEQSIVDLVLKDAHRLLT